MAALASRESCDHQGDSIARGELIRIDGTEIHSEGEFAVCTRCGESWGAHRVAAGFRKAPTAAPPARPTAWAPDFDLDRAETFEALAGVKVFRHPEVARGAAVQAVRELDFVLRWVAARGAAHEVHGVRVAVVPQPVLERLVGGYADACAVTTSSPAWVLVSEDLVWCMGAQSVLAHELAHVAGRVDEIEAWRWAAEIMAGSGLTSKHCLLALGRSA